MDDLDWAMECLRAGHRLTIAGERDAKKMLDWLEELVFLRRAWHNVFVVLFVLASLASLCVALVALVAMSVAI